MYTYSHNILAATRRPFDPPKGSIILLALPWPSIAAARRRGKELTLEATHEGLDNACIRARDVTSRTGLPQNNGVEERRAA
jgi:hypothetical protein